MQVTAAVTSCQHPAGPTVLDMRGQARACGSAADPGGDVGGTDQLPDAKRSCRTGSEIGDRMVWDPSPAGWAGGGGPELIHQPKVDAGPFGLVGQGFDQMGAAPLPQPQVVHPTGVVGGDAGGITNHQYPDSMSDGEGDNLVGGLMVGLVDVAAMATLDTAQPGPMAPPAAGAALPRFGCPSGRPGLAGLLIV
jgi:hypothetical protein